MQFFNFICEEISDRNSREWEENQVRNVFHQVWNATSFPKVKTPEPLPRPSVTHSTFPNQDTEAESAAAVEEGILSGAQQARLEI